VVQNSNSEHCYCLSIIDCVNTICYAEITNYKLFLQTAEFRSPSWCFFVKADEIGHINADCYFTAAFLQEQQLLLRVSHHSLAFHRYSRTCGFSCEYPQECYVICPMQLSSVTTVCENPESYIIPLCLSPRLL